MLNKSSAERKHLAPTVRMFPSRADQSFCETEASGTNSERSLCAMEAFSTNNKQHLCAVEAFATNCDKN